MTCRSHLRFPAEFLLVALLVLAMTLLPACAATNPNASETTAASATQPSSPTQQPTAQPTPTVPVDAKPGAPSGILRIWWSTRQSLNPLLDNSQSGQAVDRLIYQGLFQVDRTGQAIPQLALSLTWLTAGALAQINLKPGVSFQDGQPLTAADVAASLQYIQANAAVSPYAPALTQIGQISVIDASTLQLSLVRPDPWLAFALTFPVVPAASLLSPQPFDVLPGTGRFRIDQYTAGEGLMLSRWTGNEPGLALGDNQLTTIKVIEYNTLNEAMQAFTGDQIDLVSLAPEEYARYQTSSSLRFEPYADNRILLVAYNTARKKLLAESDRLLAIKRVLDPTAVAGDIGSGWGEATPVPLPAQSWLLGGVAADVKDVLDGLGDPAWGATSHDLVMLAPQGDVVYGQIASAIGRCLDGAGIGWQLVSEAPAGYWQTFSSGAYDLALMDLTLPRQPDPTWLYRDDRPIGYAPLAARSGSALAEYDTWRQKLLQQFAINSADQIAAGDMLAVTLAETAARSPWSTLLIRSAALLYGSRIMGQCQPAADNPYQGIEGLWVWSG
jgi:peptide/nickel transport system substrate-binding protein